MIDHDRSNGNESQSDSELLELSRSGDDSAYAELWRRYSAAAHGIARKIVGPSDAEDVVSDAFAETLRLIRIGKGPQQVFGPYLLATVRNRSIRWSQHKRKLLSDPIDDTLSDVEDANGVSRENSQLILSLFRTLPERWQEVLWRTEVERNPRHEIGREMGISVHGVATLAARARAGLREAWFQAHVNGATAPLRCKENLDRMGALRANRLSLRRRLQVEQHLRECKSCSRSMTEMGTAASELYVALLPALGLWGLHDSLAPLTATSSASAASVHTVSGGTSFGAPAGFASVAVSAASGLIVMVVAGSAVLPQVLPDSPRSSEHVTVQDELPSEKSDPNRATAGKRTSKTQTAETKYPEPTFSNAGQIFQRPITFDFPSGTVFSTETPLLSGMSLGRSDIVLTLSTPGQFSREMSVVASEDGRWTVRTGPLASGEYSLTARQVDRNGSEIGTQSTVAFSVDDSQALAEPRVLEIDTGGGIYRPLVSGLGQPGATMVVTLNSNSTEVTVAEDGTWTLLDTHFAVVGANSLFVTQLVSGLPARDAKHPLRESTEPRAFFLRAPSASIRGTGETTKTIEVEFLAGARVSVISSDKKFSHQLSNDLGFGSIEIRGLGEHLESGLVDVSYTTDDGSRQGPALAVPLSL